MARINCQKFDNSPQKPCFEIRPLSSRTEGIVMILGTKGTCLSRELLSEVAGDASAVDELPSPSPMSSEASYTMRVLNGWPEHGVRALAVH